jgi:hypothetical protein
MQMLAVFHFEAQSYGHWTAYYWEANYFSDPANLNESCADWYRICGCESLFPVIEIVT